MGPGTARLRPGLICTGANFLRKRFAAGLTRIWSTSVVDGAEKEKQASDLSFWPAVLCGAGNGTPVYLFHKYAPASDAYRPLRLLATNASRLLNAHTLSGSSLGALSKKAR